VVKSRVHDLAAEFGVSSEQLLAMLKDMNIFVRSHMSALEGDQVSDARLVEASAVVDDEHVARLRPVQRLEEDVDAARVPDGQHSARDRRPRIERA